MSDQAGLPDYVGGGAGPVKCGRAKQLRLWFWLALLLAATAAVLLAVPCSWAAPSGYLAVAVIDVGQGDSILVQFPNGQDMLVDAGEQEAGPRVVQYLRSRGVTRIDILVATHPHADHIGGMLRVLGAFPVGKVWDSGYIHGSRTQEDFLRTIKAKGVRFGKPKAGFTEQVGQATIKVLAPPAEPLSGTDSDANNSSIVLRITYGSVSFLLPGDMQAEERATVATWPRSTVLKVAHHGSRNGTDVAFAKAVAPEYAVISYGAGNPYGHPHAETITALQSAGAKVLSTAADGTVVFTTDGKSISYATSHTAAAAPGPAPQAAEENAGPAASAATDETYYIGNKRTKVFHRPSCHTLPSAKNQVVFRTRDEAIAQGYRPCKNCNP
jgi:competence protein ComEC